MTNDQMERAIEFMLEHHAKFSADIGELREAISELKERVNGVTETVSRLAEVQKLQGENLDRLTANVEAMREEMRDSFNKLILANEVTRKLSEDVARLTVQNSKRVTGLERRVGDLEAKQ